MSDAGKNPIQKYIIHALHIGWGKGILTTKIIYMIWYNKSAIYNHIHFFFFEIRNEAKINSDSLYLFEKMMWHIQIFFHGIIDDTENCIVDFI